MASIELVPASVSGPTPKVSVLITAYNHERYLAQALDSVLAQQTTFPFEIVVGEDCSTDATRELLRGYFARHPDVIRMVLPDENLGPNRMYVEVIRAARGEYFALLDGDDYWVSPDKLERQARFLDANDDYEVCFHNATVVHEDGERPPRPGMPELGRDAFGIDDILMADFVPTVSVMHRRVDADNLPEGFLSFEWSDWLMLVSCAERGRLRYLDDVECVYRVHGAGLWAGKDRESQIDEEIRVFEHLESILPARHRDALRSGVHRCKVQLAVERAGVPHDRPVAMLSDPPGLLPWYLNGRDVWQLPTTGRSATADLIAELEHARRLSPDMATTPHWRVATDLSQSQSECVYLVVESPQEWFGRMPGLEPYLDQFHRLLTMEDVALFALPCRDVWERQVVTKRLHEPLPRQLRGRHIDSPQPLVVTTGARLEVVGWVLGAESPVVEVRLNSGPDVLARADLGVARPDVAAAFPHAPQAATAGFRAIVDLADVGNAAELVATAVLEDGAIVVLGRIETQLSPALRAPAYSASLLSVPPQRDGSSPTTAAKPPLPRAEAPRHGLS